MWPNWKNSMTCFCAICRMYQHIMKLENRPGASFRAIFNRALELGTLSRRRVYHEAIKYERERNGGRLSPFGLSSFTAAAAIEDVKSIEVSNLLFSLSIALETMRIFVDWSIITRRMVYIFKLLTVGAHDSGMKWSKRKAKTKALKMASKFVHGDGVDILFRF